MCSFSHLRMYSGQMRFVEEIFTYSLVYNLVCFVFTGDNTCNLMLFSFFFCCCSRFLYRLLVYTIGICVYWLYYVWPKRRVNVVVIAIHSHIQPTNSCNHQQSADLFNVQCCWLFLWCSCIDHLIFLNGQLNIQRRWCCCLVLLPKPPLLLLPIDRPNDHFEVHVADDHDNDDKAFEIATWHFQELSLLWRFLHWLDRLERERVTPVSSDLSIYANYAKDINNRFTSLYWCADNFFFFFLIML